MTTKAATTKAAPAKATPAKALPTKAKAAAKPTPAKFGPTQCHHRSADGKPDCKVAITKKSANLCDAHEASWQKAARERRAAKAPTEKKAPKSAGSSPATVKAAKPAPKPAKNSGGVVHASKPPVPEMHVAAIPRVRTNAPEQAPHLVMLVANTAS